ncbi:hypothetical protein H6P81_002894 [Aristolochia fimbriata]|uniref:CCHC-type domain-containing protein n=1 Tax=Aristolochia fimbriata TaxID=158543 RepID=A0AAV7FEW8_ARIFI|nr:hypothetical protein H6P81_002894 [Aristolochia fimbriata]
MLHQPPVLKLPPSDQEQQSELLKLLLEKLGKTQVSTITDFPAFSRVPQQINSEVATKWQDKKPKQSRPPPFDIHANQESPFVIYNSYDARTIYEWNIDHESPKGVVDTLHRMFIYCNVCRAKGLPEAQVVNQIVAGLTGDLYGWWYHYLSDANRYEISTTVKIDELGDTLLDNEGHPISNAFMTFCLRIMAMFAVDPQRQAETTMYLLPHLRCRTLTDLHRYISTFRSRVMTLTDAASPYWKQISIEGLPTQFAMKVKDMLLSPGPNEEINWNNLHYGQLQTACIRQGLLLCNDLRLKKQLKRDQISPKTLGTFCQQFAYENLPERDCSKCRSTQPYKRRFPKRNPPKPPFHKKDKGKSTKRETRTSFRPKGQSSPITAKCYKCGRTGHFGRTCFAKQKQKIQELAIDEQSKQLVLQLLSENEEQNTSSESEQELCEPLDSSGSTSSTSSNTEELKDPQLDQLEAMFRMTTSLNMISSNDLSTLLESLTNQKDKELILDTLLKGKQNNPKYCDKYYTMSNLFQRHQQQNQKRLPDLHTEIKNCKQEIQALKAAYFGLVTRLEAVEEQTTPQSLSFFAGESSGQPDEQTTPRVDSTTEQYLQQMITSMVQQK